MIIYGHNNTGDDAMPERLALWTRHAIAYGHDSLSDERSDAVRFGLDSATWGYTEAAAAEERAWSKWSEAARRSVLGERYLASRGLDVAELLARGVVRFNTNGDPLVALHHLIDGRITNVVTRRRDPGDGPKALGMRGCRNTGSLVGHVGQLDRNGADVVVVTEGVIDTLTGVLAFPGCVVLGAHGAGELSKLTQAAAIRAAAIRGWLLLVPHADAKDGIAGAGERSGLAAARAALAEGLVLDESLRLVDLGGVKDLNDAWCAGWRWTW